MRKVKKDLVSKAPKADKKENNKSPKVAHLAPKAKNLPENVKEESAGMKKKKMKLGEKKQLPVSPRLKK